MTTDVEAVCSEATVAELSDRMHERPFNTYPIVDREGAVVGVVRPGDLAESRGSATTVGELSSNGVVTLSSDASLVDAIALMADRHVDSIPVVDDQRLVGIVTRTDVLRPQVDHLAHERTQPGWLTGIRLRGRAASHAASRPGPT